jgi:hypothetical protein
MEVLKSMKDQSVSNVEHRPMVLSHQPIRFETAKSWNPASQIGNIPHNEKEPSGGHPVGPINPGNGGNNNNSPFGN